MRTPEEGGVMTRLPTVAGTALALLVLISCGSGTSGERVTLPSGHEIQIIGTGQILFASGQRAFSVDYWTSVDLDDAAARTQEADEVWAVMKPQVPQGPFTAAVLKAQQVTSSTLGGLFKRTRGYNFVIQRNGDGSWPARLPTGAPTPKK
jgi:hypothetical protein